MPYRARLSVAARKRRETSGALAGSAKSGRQGGDRMAARYDLGGMKKCVCLLIALVLFPACEQKTTTVNPPGDTKESNTTVVNPPSEKKETNTTVVNPPGQKESTSTKTDVNVNTSPNP